MATSQDILKEYLISIGVKADTGALSKFASIVGNIEKLALSMTTALVAGIGAIEGLVAVTTSELDDLYWATRRLKSSASDIEDFQLRMSKAGTTAAKARQALESLSQFRRTNPASSGLLSLFGIKSQGKGDVEVMDALINRFKQLNAQGQYWLAVRQGEMLGLSEDQIWSMVNAGPKESVYKNLNAKMGINQKAIDEAHKYQNELKNLGAQFTVTAQALGLKFLPAAEHFLEWLATSPEVDAMGNALLGVAGDLNSIAGSIGKLFSALPSGAQEFGIIGLLLFGPRAAIVMAAIGAASSLGDKLFNDQNKINEKKLKEYGEGKEYAANRSLYDSGLGYLNTNEFNTTYAEYLYRKQHPEKKPGPQIPGPGPLDSVEAAKQSTQTSTDTVKKAITPFVDSVKKAWEKTKTFLTPLGIRSNNPGNLQPGGQEAVYKTPEDGLAAMAGVLRAYSKRGLNTVSDIIKKYAPEFDKNGKRINPTPAYIRAVSNEMGVKEGDKLDVSNPAVLQKLMRAMIRVENGFNPYSDQMIGAAAGMTVPTMKAPVMAAPAMKAPALGAATGDKNITITQHNTTTIHGAKDPKTTAKHIERVSDRTNGDLIRNLSKVVV